MIRVGVIGAGAHSESAHGPALAAIAKRDPDRLVLAAVCDVDEEKRDRYATKFGFRNRYADVDVMLHHEELDCVLLLVPATATELLAPPLLRSGVPLLIEKPPANSSAVARSLRDLAVEYAAPHMVSFNRPFNPAVLKAREWLRSLPPVRLVDGAMLRNARDEVDFVVGTGIHLVDLLLNLFGVPREVATNRSELADESLLFQSTVRWSDSLTGLITIAPTAGRWTETVQISGSGYTIDVDIQDMGATLWRDGELVEEWREPRSDYQAFADTLLETEQLLMLAAGDPRFAGPTLPPAVVAVSLCEAIQAGKSWRP